MRGTGDWTCTSAVVLCAATIAAPTQAHSLDGWYVAGAATYSLLRNPHQSVANAPTPGSTLRLVNSVDSALGWQAEIGRAFGPMRIEAEVGRTDNRPTSYTVTSPFMRSLPQTGKFAVTRVMANGSYDITRDVVRPYLGLGAGIARVHVVTIGPRAPFPTETPRTLIDDNASHFAWQAIAGMSIAASQHLAIVAQYRWFDAGRIRGHDTRGQQFTETIASHNIDVGLRFSF